MNSYLNYYQVPLTLKKNLAKFNDWEDINNKEVKFAVTLGTVHEQMAKDFLNVSTKHLKARLAVEFIKKRE